MAWGGRCGGWARASRLLRLGPGLIRHTAGPVVWRRRRGWRIWLGLEHAASPGHEAIAGGWLGRAERLLGGLVARVGMAVAGPRRASRPIRFGWLITPRCRVDFQRVRRCRVGDTGVGTVRAGSGSVGSSQMGGWSVLTQAMAASTTGEAKGLRRSPNRVGTWSPSCETALTGRRPSSGAAVAEQILEVRPYPPLLSFWASCCAGVLAARGDIAAAGAMVNLDMEKLEKAAMRPGVSTRSSPRGAGILPGRFEEA